MTAAALVLTLLGVAAPARGAAPAVGDVAFYDGGDNLVDALAVFSAVVLNPERATPDIVGGLARAGSVPLGRLTVAEGGSRDDLLAQARRLAVAGYQGALLEAGSSATPRTVADAVTALRGVWPQGPLLLAADPRLAVQAAPELSAVVVRRALDRAARLAAFARSDLAAGRAGPVPIIDVESVPASARADAQRLVEQIHQAGLTPWVTVGGGDRLGMGAIQPIPRRVLVVQDRVEEPSLAASVAHRLLALPLEYLGYAVDYADVRAPLPAGDLRARYAGIVTWFTDDDLPGSERYERWLRQQIDDGIKVAIIDHLGFSPSAAFLARLGLVVPGEAARPPLQVAASDDWVGFEAPAAARARERPPWDAPGLKRHLEIADAAGHRLAPVAHGEWGGIALAPYVTAEGVEGRSRWILDPFRFLAGALALPPIPVPDPTTANGRRLMEIHVDGDGFVSVAELPDRPFAGEVIRREVLARYQLPTTVSIIEGEIGPTGLYPDKSPALEEIARRIFARPEVEIASHTYSHPFDWARAGAPSPDASVADDRPEDDRLQIPGYAFSLEREVDGSVAYINQRLAPPGKATRTFLWSGDALPPEEAIERTDALQLENLNGDDAEEPGARVALSQVPSFVRPVGRRTQVYAPAQNENVYTNLWRGPFYGFRRVIDYFRFTDSPRRLKPIGIYYHFYSGTKAAAIKALHEVYGWALQQETFPVWASEYAAQVRGFEEARVARRLDGSWVLRGFGALTTVRLPAALGWPDLDRSTGVVGVRDLPQGRYVALAPGGSAVLAIAGQSPAGPYLTASNAAVVSFQRDGNVARLHLRGHVPVEAEIGGCTGALAVRRAPPPQFMRASAVKPRAPGNVSVKGHTLRFAESDTGEIDVICH
jgi:hypothetical protein